RGEKQTKAQSCGAPGRHAIRTGNQVTNSALKSTATRFLFHFACARTANVVHERRAQNAGDPFLSDDAAQLVRCYSKQRKIKQAKSSGQAVLLNGNPCYYGHTCQIKAE